MKSDADRSKAARIRRLRKAGKATPEMKRWLEGYERGRGASPIGRAAPPARQAPAPASAPMRRGAVESAPEPATAPEPVADAPPTAPPSPDYQLPEDIMPGESPIEVDDDDADDDDDDDDDDASSFADPMVRDAQRDRLTPDGAVKPANPHAAVTPLKTCGNPSCPACSKRVGGSVCSQTGIVVWDPLDMEAARGVAHTFLMFTALAVKFVRKDKQYIAATDDELNAMARAIQKVTYRRLNAIGAIDDLLMLAAAFGMFVRRAASEPTKADESKPAEGA